ncbi:MAG: hypothetical protein HGB11_12770 [Chlorobiales bacterium]|nr:hypothetical protein [Chlorobiales bacterium]
MKKIVIIGGLLLSSFMFTDTTSAQPTRHWPDDRRVEREKPNDKRHGPDFDDHRREYPERYWHGAPPPPNRVVMDRVANRLLLNRAQKKRVYAIMAEPADYRYRGRPMSRWEREEYMRWKRRQMDRQICDVLSERQKKIYFEMRGEGIDFAIAIRP